MIYIIIKIKMELTQLEQQKISLTKELEKVEAKIKYYNLDKIKYGNDEFKEMIARRDRIRHKIEELKKKIDGEERVSLSI